MDRPYNTEWLWMRTFTGQDVGLDRSEKNRKSFSDLLFLPNAWTSFTIVSCVLQDTPYLKLVTRRTTTDEAEMFLITSSKYFYINFYITSPFWPTVVETRTDDAHNEKTNETPSFSNV